MNTNIFNRRKWLTTVTAATTSTAVTLSTQVASSAPMGKGESRVHGDMLLLAIDDVSLPFRKNLGLYLSKPAVRPEAVLKPSPFGSGAPDDLAAHFYGTVLHDGGKFRTLKQQDKNVLRLFAISVKSKV